MNALASQPRQWKDRQPYKGRVSEMLLRHFARLKTWGFDCCQWRLWEGDVVTEVKRGNYVVMPAASEAEVNAFVVGLTERNQALASCELLALFRGCTLAELRETHGRIVRLVAAGAPGRPPDMFRKYVAFVDLLERRIEELSGVTF